MCLVLGVLQATRERLIAPGNSSKRRTLVVVFEYVAHPDVKAWQQEEEEKLGGQIPNPPPVPGPPPQNEFLVNV